MVGATDPAGIRLGVNVDHVATVRQARGTSYPSPIAAALLCEEAGAHGITIHLREDRRHIQDRDVRDMKDAISIPLNLELACAEDVVELALAVGPREVCIVPEKRAERTTEGGLDVAGGLDALRPVVAAFGDAGVAVSLFIEPDEEQVRSAQDLGAPIIELHTGRFCDLAGPEADAELDRLKMAAGLAHGLGLQVNAGHGIHLGIIDEVLRVPHLDTLNIGHSIVAEAIFVGMKQAVRDMLAACGRYRGGDPVCTS